MNSTHSVTMNGNLCIKRFNSRGEYLTEKRVLNKLDELDISFTVKAKHIDERNNAIHYIREDVKGTLEVVLGRGIIPVKVRKHYWAQIANMLRVLHMHSITHGDFKSKNILVKHDDTLLLCDFDLSSINQRNEKEYMNDKKKAFFIKCQLFMIRHNDRHHWVYENEDKNFRNGEQIYDDGPEFQRDLYTLLIEQILD